MTVKEDFNIESVIFKYIDEFKFLFFSDQVNFTLAGEKIIL